MAPAVDTQMFDVAAFLEHEEASWPAPSGPDPARRDPELAQVEEAWRTGRLSSHLDL